MEETTRPTGFRSDPRVQEELRREVAFRRAIEDSMLAGVSAVDLEGRQVYVNPAFAEMLGWSAEELVGAIPPYVYWPEEEVGRIQAAFEQTLRGEAPAEGFDLRFQRRGGERFDVQVLISPLVERDERTGWLACTYDVSGRKRVERRLRDEDERLRLALEAGQLGAWEWDVGEGRVVWSEELAAIHGLKAGSFGGTFEAFQEDMHPADRERVLEAIQTALGNAPADYRVEYRIARPDGEIRWLEARGRAIADAEGRPVRMIGVCQDTTERLEEKIRAEHAAARLEILAGASSALAATPDYEDALRQLAAYCVATVADYAISYSIEKDGTIRRVGIAHAVPEKQPLAEELASIGAPELDDEHGAGAVLRTGEPVLVTEIPDGMLERAAQNERHLEVLRKLGPRSSILVPLTAGEGPVGVLAVATTDDSDRRYSENDLVLIQELALRAGLLVNNARLYREAQTAAAAREELMAVLSHDLRDPLHSILLTCRLLDQGATPPDQAVERIERAAGQMDRLVSDLLDVTLIEGGQLTIERKPVDLAELVRETARRHQSQAEEKDLELGVDVVTEDPVLEGDPDRLSQVLSNLVGNAIKFTPAGGRVDLRLENDRESLRILVTDTGPGIPADHQPHVFDRFWRADRRSDSGTGLGLSIVKAIVEAHGGTVGVESETGRGSTFRVRFPRGA